VALLASAAHIHPGSLPKGLRLLDLSRNKIASIEGLRELTRLRVLNLSYNRISRIRHGKQSMFLTMQCTMTFYQLFLIFRQCSASPSTQYISG
jgi:Leucine-rich repeat (LRR) protein